MPKINYNFYDGKQSYNDGKIEKELLMFYKGHTTLDCNRDDVFFHTTNIRQNIVNWYPFKKNSNILEIGAGLGPVTGALLKNGNKVISVEASRQRAEVIFNRYKNYDNLEIYCANFNDIDFDIKFDYIVLIGVFEYSSIFSNGKNPFYSFLKNISKCLKENGKILIAIENQFGIKYFAGLSEDHYKTPYVGIQGYDENDIRTFGRKELRKLFSKLNLNSKFYGVFPDYKLPEFIFSENYCPSANGSSKFTYYNYYNDYTNFNQAKVAKELCKNDLLIDFSNSFFIELSHSKDFFNIDFVSFQNSRDDNYKVATVVGDKVEKIPLTNQAINHLEELVNTHKYLNDNGITSCSITKENNKYICEKIDGITVLEQMRLHIDNNDFDSIVSELDKFNDYIHKISSIRKIKNPITESVRENYSEMAMLPIGLMDLHLDNIIKKDGTYILIDQEWAINKDVPLIYYLILSLNVLFDRIPEINKFQDISFFYDKYNISEKDLTLFSEINNYYFNIYKNYKNKFIDNKLIEKNNATLSNDDKSSLYQKLNLCNEKIKKYKMKDYFNHSNLEFYKENYKNVVEQNKALNDTIDHLNKRLIHKNNFYNRKIFKLAINAQKIADKLLPCNSLRKKAVKFTYKVIKSIIKFVLKFAKFILKFVIKLIPSKKAKRKLLYKIHTSKKLSNLLRVIYYPNLPKKTYIQNNQEYPITNLLMVNKRIAVHLHLYYTDLLDEFYRYLSNIPYPFDLYVSTSSKKYNWGIKSKLSHIVNVGKVYVQTSPNCGRDFGPMIVLFGNQLKNYDYLLHIHSKKSLRTGVEQNSWRNYLLNGLLGTKELIMQYFDLMENHNVGLAYPDTYKGVSYIAHTWLQSKFFVDKYFSEIGVKTNDEYLDFSAGSMFWCKIDSIKQLFDVNLTWEDFGQETGKDEGTLAHSIERLTGVLNKFNSYSYSTFNAETNKFYIDYSKKNISEYTIKNRDKAIETLLNHKVITFDIFDTLITRKLYNPDDVFDIIDRKVGKKYGLKSGQYKYMRKKAEEEARKKKNYQGDVDIYKIYEEFKSLSKLSTNDVNEIMQMEISTDLSTMTPREDMKKIYYSLLKENKQIILISDMYYTKDIIADILDKNGYKNYFKILVSSDVGFRKDNGTMWDYYFNTYKNVDSIHVGDNETSDIYALMKLTKPCYHIMQSKKLYQISNVYIDKDLDADNNLIRALIINKKLFNSPFVLDKNKNVIVSDLSTYGYSFLGPIMLYYFNWLIKNIDKDETLLFISREGYFLQKIYNDVIRNSSKHIDNPNKYFLISRRAISIPNIKSVEDIKEILNTYYNGTLKEGVLSRLGIILSKEYANMFINLPNDTEKVINIISNEFDNIILNAKKEKCNYMKYINNLGGIINNKLCIVDLGYSGTAQYYLSKMLNQKVSGAYFVVSDNLKPLSLGNTVKSCFNDTIYDNSLLSHPVGKYSLLLESFLTSGCGQLIHFDENGKPIYLNTGDNNIDSLNEIYNGIKEFIDDIASIIDKDILDLNLDKNFIEENFEKLIMGSHFSSDIINTLNVEDLYASSSNIDVFKRLNKQKVK